MSEEKEIWSEKASMLDFAVNPVKWILTIGTLGIWFFVTYLSRLSTRYTLTEERLIVTKGLLSKSVDEVELFRVKDAKVSQSFLERLVGIGKIEVKSSDDTGTLLITNIPKAVERRESIRKYYIESRQKKGIATVVHE